MPLFNKEEGCENRTHSLLIQHFIPLDKLIQESKIENEIRGVLDECIRLRRELHRHPELSLHEERTARTISLFLSEHGLKTKSYDFPSVVCDTAPHPVVALRADMDALPVEEASGEEFSSENKGVMHACGHDAHSAMLVCTGVVLHRLGVPVRLIFQPAEELGRGAKMMIEAGALDGIHYIFGLHVWPSIDVGSIAVLNGPAMAAHDEFHITFKGPGGHGAYPHLTRDTVLAASNFILSSQGIVSRVVDPLESAVLSYGRIEGGHASNVIPSKLLLEGTVRTFTPEVRAQIRRSIEQLLGSVCLFYGTEGNIQWEEGGPAVINDSEFAEQCRKVLNGKIKVVDYRPTMGSEDFAYYLQKVRGAFAFLGTGSDSSTRASKHSSIFRLDERSLYYGIMSEVLVASFAGGLDGDKGNKQA